MSGSSKLDCVKRLAKVLAGKVEPSVEAVITAARGVTALANNPIEPALRKLYDGIVAEPVPADMLTKLNQIDGPRHYVPSRKGGNNGEGRHRPD